MLILLRLGKGFIPGPPTLSRRPASNLRANWTPAGLADSTAGLLPICGRTPQQHMG